MMDLYDEYRMMLALSHINWYVAVVASLTDQYFVNNSTALPVLLGWIVIQFSFSSFHPEI